MANLRENLSTFRAVSEGPSFCAGLISAVILGVSGLILLWLAVPEGSFSFRVPWQLVPVVLSTVIIAVIYYLGTVNYASNKRLELRGVTNPKGILDRLSEYLEEGNSGILNATPTNPQEYAAWYESYRAWMKTVEEYLEKHFGVREKLMFRHIVLLKHELGDGYTPEHIHHRNILAWKLLTLKEIILRYSVSNLRTSEILRSDRGYDSVVTAFLCRRHLVTPLLSRRRARSRHSISVALSNGLSR